MRLRKRETFWTVFIVLGWLLVVGAGAFAARQSGGWIDRWKDSGRGAITTDDGR